MHRDKTNAGPDFISAVSSRIGYLGMHKLRPDPGWAVAIFGLLFGLSLSSATLAQERIRLEPGLVITSDATVQPGTYNIPADSMGAIVIRGHGITVDFAGAILDGATEGTVPDEFTGTGIRIDQSSGVTIRNATVRGYKVGLHATDAPNITILGGDFSYNYRQRLKSTLEREHLDDWMSYHSNENDEWLRYGAAIYLRRADGARVEGVIVTGGQNGIMATQVNGATFTSNTIVFNSGIGIGLYRSSRNQIMSNRIDWNVRGYSHGVYNRGQDSAAILLYEQSNENAIWYNSATHSGDGLFLWAGQTTMDTGEGGCNDNGVFANDFSFAPTNGIEVTFSRNFIANNRIEGCWHGVWGGYSYATVIRANEFVDNDEHIAIEHGQDIEISENTFAGGTLGIRAWERLTQPEDWGYSRARDVSSREYDVARNVFHDVDVPISIANTDGVVLRGNHLGVPQDSLVLTGSTGLFHGAFGYTPPGRDAGMPPIVRKMLADTPSLRGHDPGDASVLSTDVSPGHPRSGRSYILVDEWGPHDFRSPVAWPRSDRRGRDQTFEMLGPPGLWRIVSMQGVDSVSARTGRMGDTLHVRRGDDPIVDMRMELEFRGDLVADRFGEETPAGEPYRFTYAYSHVPLAWSMSFYNYDDTSEPRSQPDAFRRLLDAAPVYTEVADELGYQWYGSPHEGVGPNHFATVAEATIDVPPGTYRFELTSDDGVRMWVDGELVHDDWTYHPPRTAEIELELDGRHELRIEHFEIDGYATLVGVLR